MASPPTSTASSANPPPQGEPLVAILFQSLESDPPTPPDTLTHAFLTALASSASLTHTSPPTWPHTRTTHSAAHRAIHILHLTPPIPLPLPSPSALRAFEAAHRTQSTLQPASLYTTPKRLAVFDMDSTLIAQEAIDLLAGAAGPDALKAVSDITARAMNGELDFAASLRERVALLRGLPAEETWDVVRGQVSLVPGAKALAGWCRASGVRMAVASGGFMPLAGWVAERLLGIETTVSNQLQVDSEGRFTGRLEEGWEVVDAERKRRLVEELRAEMGLRREEVLAVGDGANDLPMLKEAGLGVAVNAKKKVQEEAPQRLNGPEALGDVRWLCGWTGEEVHGD